MKNFKLLVIIRNRSQGGLNLSFPHVFGGNPYFFRQMDARQKHSGMTEAFILSHL
ncbi:hypothetical protein JW964_26455 [candidate division KSB1 bacterium]|nr:hypothetical protein [candidate division KSB1 bacterium]